MSRHTDRQAARRASIETSTRRRTAQAEKNKRLSELTYQVLLAIADRDRAITETECRAGKAIRDMTDTDGLTITETLDWLGDTLTARETRRLRRLDDDEPTGKDGGAPSDRPA